MLNHQIRILLLTLIVVSSLSISSSLFHISIANNFHTVIAQAKTNTASLPFFFFPQPEKTIPLMKQQHQQLQPIRGFMSNGTVNSLIKTPTADWIASGNWTLNLNYDRNNTYFKTDMTWFNNNGKTSHTHEFQNFRFTPKANITATVQPGNNIVLKGIMDVGTNHRIVWKNVPTTIDINGEKTITISVADNATNHHFAGQPIFGLVSSFVPLSK